MHVPMVLELVLAIAYSIWHAGRIQARPTCFSLLRWRGSSTDECILLKWGNFDPTRMMPSVDEEGQ